MVRAIDMQAVICFAGYMAAEQGNNGANIGSSPAEKVKVVGRLGQPPQFRSIPDKQAPDQELFIGNFSIAEHPDRESTVWHDVAVFGERARKFQEAFENGDVKVGQEIEVVGAVHRRERPTKDGGTKEVEQIYAYAIVPARRDLAPAAAEPETPPTS